MGDSVSTIGSYSGYVSLILILVGGLIAACQRHRIRSTCCGAEASLALESTTPERKPSVTTDGGQASEKEQRLVGAREEGSREESRQAAEGGHGEGKRVI